MEILYIIYIILFSQSTLQLDIVTLEISRDELHNNGKIISVADLPTNILQILYLSMGPIKLDILPNTYQYTDIFSLIDVESTTQLIQIQIAKESTDPTKFTTKIKVGDLEMSLIQPKDTQLNLDGQIIISYDYTFTYGYLKNYYLSSGDDVISHQIQKAISFSNIQNLKFIAYTINNQFIVNNATFIKNNILFTDIEEFNFLSQTKYLMANISSLGSYRFSYTEESNDALNMFSEISNASYLEKNGNFSINSQMQALVAGSNDSKLQFQTGKQIHENGIAISFWIKLPNKKLTEFPLINFENNMSITLQQDTTIKKLNAMIISQDNQEIKYLPIYPEQSVVAYNFIAISLIHLITSEYSIYTKGKINNLQLDNSPDFVLNENFAKSFTMEFIEGTEITDLHILQGSVFSVNCEEIQHCSLCFIQLNGTFQSKCVECQDSYYLLANGSCNFTCPDGYYTQLTTKSCKKCHPFCQTCSGSTKDKCLTCITPLTLNSQTGLCEPQESGKEALVLINYNQSSVSLEFKCKDNYEQFKIDDINSCVSILCANGQIDIGEQCDDQNRISNDGCTYDCIREQCANQDQERRRAPNKTEVCIPIKCGNGLIETNEECDDNNKISEDGCDYQCKKEPCPELQERRRRSNDTKEVCVSTKCGNGVIENGEECDDLNKQPGDGCSFECKKESPKSVQNGYCDSGFKLLSNTALGIIITLLFLLLQI